MKKDNRGFSLVELIVVIAIMAVMVGILVFSMSILTGAQARECAQKVSSQLDSTKTGSMSRYDETMELSYLEKDSIEEVNSDGFYTKSSVYSINKYAAGYEITEPVYRKVGTSKVKVTVYLKDGSSYEIGKDAGNTITVGFNRASGAFNKAIVNGSATTTYFDYITFESGIKTYTIVMVPETGKHTVQ